MKKIPALVLTGYGLNCDLETAFALESAGARVRRIHINSLIEGQAHLADYKILVFGGGFSWGDDHGAGVVQAVRMKTHLGPKLIQFIENGNLVLGICNGFQTLVNLGLLPAVDGDYSARRVALTYNDCGNFRDQWVKLRVNPDSPCVFTRGMQTLSLPVRHGEGKFFAAGDVITRLFENGQVVMQYAASSGAIAAGTYPANPNGSLGDIAGICDPSGRVFGLMPHPEAYNHPTNHPDWAYIHECAKRSGKALAPESTPGIRLFANAVRYLAG